MLATKLHLPVVPMRIDGLFELKQTEKRMARAGDVRVTIGAPVSFAAGTDADSIARELERRVAEL